jgi:hypothetical protein
VTPKRYLLPADVTIPFHEPVGVFCINLSYRNFFSVLTGSGTVDTAVFAVLFPDGVAADNTIFFYFSAYLVLRVT